MNINDAIKETNRNWGLITGVSVVYVYYLAISSSYLYYREFNVPIFMYFDFSDYFRILLLDNKTVTLLPLIGVTLIYMATMFSKPESLLGQNHKFNRFLKGCSSALWVVLICIILFLPGFHSWEIAKRSKVESKRIVKVISDDRVYEGITEIGRSSNYLFFYSVSDNSSIILRLESVKAIQVN